jgi:carbonic anhydrase/acetyltransferase-like protein (isoleucine patch superfamily)
VASPTLRVLKVPIKAYQDKLPDIGNRVLIDETAVVIGDVVLGDDVSLWPLCVLRGDVNRIEIGPRTNIQDGCVLHVTHRGEHSPVGYPLLVGEEVTVGHRVVLHGCRIGNHCLIGIGAIVMDGAVIADEVILGAGSLVPPGRILESGFLYLGSPARKARPLTDQEKAFLRYSARHYVSLKNEYSVFNI